MKRTILFVVAVLSFFVVCGCEEEWDHDRGHHYGQRWEGDRRGDWDQDRDRQWHEEHGREGHKGEEDEHGEGHR